jgi:phosphopantetheinyl transferase
VYRPEEGSQEFAPGPFGKPFASGSPFHFNISHSHDSLVIAVSLADVGIDLERKRPVVTDQLAMACMSRPERAELSLMSGPAALEYFFRIWTAKEALLKASGVGLQVEMKQISLMLSDGIGIESLPACLGSVSDWSLSPLRLASDTAAALAARSPLDESRILQCSVDASSIDIYFEGSSLFPQLDGTSSRKS